jgi:hypothetical protein
MMKHGADGNRTKKKGGPTKTETKDQSNAPQKPGFLIQQLQHPQKQYGLEVETPNEKLLRKKQRKRRCDKFASGEESAETLVKIKLRQDSKKEKHQFEHYSRSSSPILEGTMVGNNMVLIDRKTGQAYSSTDRKRDGKRKRIGYMDDLGVVVLKKTGKKLLSTLSNAKHSGMFHVS